MKPYKIGNWIIKEHGIYWDDRINNYKLPKDSLMEIRDNMFDWLIHMASKTWLKKEDVYALNTAFIFAIEAFNFKIPKDVSWIKTLKLQEEIIKKKKEK